MRDERAGATLAEVVATRMLELSHLTKRFGAVAALDGCSLTVERGQMLGFLGPNGAGKTTAMRCVFELVRPDSGEVRWEGRPVGLAERLRFGYMPEERGLYPRMAVADELAYFAELHDLAPVDARERVGVLLERLGLGDRGGAKVEQLSHGNQQRVQLAAALVHEPDLLVLDEPFSGLDPLAVVTLVEVLRDEARRGAAVLFSSHQLDLVEDLCDAVAIIDRGRTVASGAVADLKSASGRRRIELEYRNDAQPPAIAGLQPLGRENNCFRFLVGTDVDPQAVLTQAERAGEVVRFSYGPPSLTELFLETVAR